MGSRPSTMASTQMDSSETKSISAKSGYQPTVCLKDWWLIRVDADSQGRTLAVAGLTSREHQALRVFRSAPILKVFDVFTLETVDGICVVLRGFINKTRTVENGFPSEVFKHFLFGFPPQWEAFNQRCLGRDSEEVKDSNNIDQKDHVEATGEEIQEHDGRNDCEVEVDLRRDDQSDGEVASEVIVRKKTNKGTKSSQKPNSAKTSTSIETTGDEIQEHDGTKDYEGEDHLRRDKRNDGEVASEVIVGKKTNKATKSSHKRNSAKTSTSVEAAGDEIHEHDGRKDCEGEDHLRRDNRNGGEVASEVIVGKKTNKATKSSHKPNSAKASTSVEAAGDEIHEHDGRKDCEGEDHLRRDNRNGGEVASEVIIGKKTNKATKSSHKPNSAKASTSIEAAGDEIHEHDGRKDYEGEDHLRRDNRNGGEVASEVIVGKKTNKATKSSHKPNSAKASTSIEATGDEIQEHDGRKDYEGEDHLRRDNRNDGEVIVGKKTNKATKSSHKLNSAKISTSIEKKRTADDSRTPHFKSGSASARNTRRKLAYGSPQKEKEADSVFSPESSSFKRSRSGRLLLPPMAFWRNERAIYDANRGVTAIKQADLDQDNLSRVSRSEPSRKRRQLR